MEYSFIGDNSILLNLGLAHLEQTLIKLWYAVFGTVSVGMTILLMLQKLAHTAYPNKSEWLAHIKLIFHQSVQYSSDNGKRKQQFKNIIFYYHGDYHCDSRERNVEYSSRDYWRNRYVCLFIMP